MKLIEKILVATDFSQHSRDALRMAVLLAKRFHSEIILIHVIPEIKDYPIVRNKIRKKVTEKLKQMESSLKRIGIASWLLGGFKIRVINPALFPWHQVIDHLIEIGQEVWIYKKEDKIHISSKPEAP